jgi:hypothetical protein
MLNGKVPPVMVKLALPLALPQKAGVVLADAVMANGAVMVVLPVALQPLASVTVTVKVPEVNPLLAAVVRPLLHAKI